MVCFILYLFDSLENVGAQQNNDIRQNSGDEERVSTIVDRSRSSTDKRNEIDVPTVAG